MLLNFINLVGWQLFRVAIGWMKIFPGGSFPGWELCGWEFLGWKFSWVGVVWVGFILGGNLFWWKFSGWELSGGNHPGGNFLGGSFDDTGKRYHITMSPQSQYAIGLYRNVNPTKNRCRHNIGCPLGWCFQGVKKGCIGKKWVKIVIISGLSEGSWLWGGKMEKGQIK